MADYRDAKAAKQGSAGEKEDQAKALAAPWWMLEESLVGSAFQGEVNSLSSNKTRHNMNVRHTRLYENMMLGGFDTMSWESANRTLATTGALSFNVVQSAIDTLASKILKSKPRPSFQTSIQGGWKKRQSAKRLDKFCRGLFYDMKLYKKARPVGVDSMVYGTGAMKFFVDPLTKRLNCERAFIDELYVDEADAKYGEPRCMYQRKLVAKSMMKAAYPEYAAEIDSQPGVEGYDGRESNMVEVWEGWHLPSGRKTGDGKHIITVGPCCLVNEEWNLQTFPFAFLQYSKRMLGFWGRGVAERLTGIQKEMNRLTRSVSDQLQRKGRGRTWAPYGSINPAQVTNAVGSIAFYKGGTAPHVDSQPAVSQEEFAQIDRLYQRAYQEVGVSELSAGSKKPAGLDAAVAMREYNEIESDRFATFGQDYEYFLCMDCTTVALAMIEEFCPRNYMVRLPNRQNAIEINRQDIDLKDDAYTVEIFPVSSLPLTPAARLQRVGELVDGGYIDKAKASELLDMPDIDDALSLLNAAADDVDATISAILDDEEPVLMPLEPYQDMVLMSSRARAAYLRARHWPDIEEQRLSMLRDLINQSSAKAAEAAAPAPMPGLPPGAPQPGMPPAGPGPSATGIQNLNITAPSVSGAQPAVPPLVG